MRRFRIKPIIVATVVLLAAIQIVPVSAHNAPVVPSHSIYSVQAMPPQVRSVFENSCNDCHSSETHWPWYSHIAPVSWIVAHDVREGRKHVNFSEWGTYSPKKQEDKLELICEQVTNGDMPDAMYAFFHRQSRLTQDQRDAVCEWVETARANLDSE